MYFIKKITVQDKDQYVSSEIVGYTTKTISNALILLENSAKSFIQDECGKQVASASKIIDIHDFNQVSEPMIDTMLIYRLGVDPHRLHVYQRKTKATNGYLWGQTVAPEFRKIQIFELEECAKFGFVDSANHIETKEIVPVIEMVPVGPAKRVMIPKAMTVAPMCNLISELKNSQRFKNRFASVNASVAPASAPIVDRTIAPTMVFARVVKHSAQIMTAKVIRPEPTETVANENVVVVETYPEKKDE